MESTNEEEIKYHSQQTAPRGRTNKAPCHAPRIHAIKIQNANWSILSFLRTWLQFQELNIITGYYIEHNVK